MSIRIESRENSLVKRLVRLSNDRKFRKEMQEMVCEGEKMLGEALSSGMDIHDILVAENAELDTELLRQAEGQGAKLYICPSSLLSKVSNVKTPQGVVFSLRETGRRAARFAGRQASDGAGGIAGPGKSGHHYPHGGCICLGRHHFVRGVRRPDLSEGRSRDDGRGVPHADCGGTVGTNRGIFA